MLCKFHILKGSSHINFCTPKSHILDSNWVWYSSFPSEWPKNHVNVNGISHSCSQTQKKSFPLAPTLTKSCAHMTDGQLWLRCIWRLKGFYILPQTVKLSVNTKLTTRWLVDKSPVFLLSRKRLNNVSFSTFDGNIACISVSNWIWRCWNVESFAYFQLVFNA